MPGDSHFEMSSVDGTVIAVWVGEPSATRLQSMVDRLSALHQVHPEGVYLLNVITASTGMPDQETRKAIARQFDSMRGRLLAASIVLEKPGLEGTLSRTVISTLVTISRRPFELKIFSRRDQAASWLAERCGVSASVLANQVTQLEATWSKGPKR